MTNRPETGRPTLIERRVRRITNARSVTIGLALTYVALALVGAIVIRIVDEHDFPTLGLAVWWAVQTVTTVGYGDVVPTTKAGQFIGGAEMVLGVSFIAFLVAGVTSAVIQRTQAGAAEDEQRRDENDLRTIINGLAELRAAISALDKRLDKIE